MRHIFFSLIAGLALGFIAIGQAHAENSYFQVAREDVAVAVSAALAERGAAPKVSAVVYSANPVLYTANSPLKVAIQALNFDTESHKWQANMHIISDNKTISVSPIQGRYETVTSVPVLTRKTANGDIISDADITMMDIPERQIHKDTAMNAEDLIGKSPKRSISPDRPIRLSEINLPTIVKKGSSVEVQYSAPYMTIRTIGEALEDGSLGSTIRVKNEQSGKAITARVIGTGKVEVNSEKTIALN